MKPEVSFRRLSAALLAVLASVRLSVGLASHGALHPRYDSMVQAAETMQTAMDVIRDLRLSQGIPIDGTEDPNGTGLIGMELTGLTTTVGDPVSKRTSLNPDFAALTLAWFGELGLEPGDRVAIAASGSFPGILLAVLSACSTAGLEPVTVLSLGASEYGANIPGLSSAEMITALREKGVFPWQPAAVSLGGEGDRGVSGFLFVDSRPLLESIAVSSGLTYLSPLETDDAEKSLAEDAARRLELYFKDGPPHVFVNIGGGEVAYGSTSASLELHNGIIRDVPFKARGKTRGLIFEFLERGIPVIHFLDIKGMAMANGLPVDPVPFPEKGESAVYRVTKPAKLPAIAGILAGFLILLPRGRRRR